MDTKNKTHQEERKLAAIMFTDIQGFTKLMAKDEEYAIKLVEVQNQIIEALVDKYKGRIVKTIGDAVTGDFASAVNAVKCAINIQEEIEKYNKDKPESKKIFARIGIHLGDVVIKGKDIFGDGVNIASRIEPLAEPGGICISHHVYHQIKNIPGVKTMNLGLRELKNVEEPIEIYMVLVEEPMIEKMSDVREVSKLKSVAVLPFVDISPAKDNEYFSDGITEEIITDLSRIRELKVPSRTSIMRYKKSDKDIRQIGKELAVKYVLEGSVRKHENRLRIAAQLINVEDGFHVWTDTYDGVLKDVFDFQEQVSRHITKALKVHLTEGEKNQMSQQATANVQTYEHYLMGKYHLSKWTRQGIKSAIKLFEKALKLDPDYAPAYAAIAMAYFALVWWSYRSTENLVRKG